MMNTQTYEFHDTENAIWDNLEKDVRKLALDRSGSKRIADRVVDMVGKAYERSVPATLSIRYDSPDSLREDLAKAKYLVVGNLINELATIAIAAQMLLGDPEPSNSRLATEV